MRYRTDPKSGNRLSVLGFGLMRLPRNINTRIDIDKAEALILAAIEQGVNYFDTAYVYGGSEQAFGAVIQRNPAIREKMYIATKLPHTQCKTATDFDRIFETQLSRIAVDYFDYYLIHNLPSMADWERLRGLGIEQWIAGKKKSGQIRQIGFSFHGVQDAFLALLDAYDWEFCQMQYNYMNEQYQAGRKGLLRAHEKGLPVVVMEPLLGGKLAEGLPKKALKRFQAADKDRTPAAWALQWLWHHKEVTLLLSGMNTLAQLTENARTAETAEPGMLSGKEIETVKQAEAAFRQAYKIPCTGCNYCLPCPKGVNIPGCFAAYNVAGVSGYIAGMAQYLTSTGALNARSNTSGRNCVACGQCEGRCPQHIKIIKQLKTVTKRMEPPWFGVGRSLLMKLRK